MAISPKKWSVAKTWQKMPHLPPFSMLNGVEAPGVRVTCDGSRRLGEIFFACRNASCFWLAENIAFRASLRYCLAKFRKWEQNWEPFRKTGSQRLFCGEPAPRVQTLAAVLGPGVKESWLPQPQYWARGIQLFLALELRPARTYPLGPDSLRQGFGPPSVASGPKGAGSHRGRPGPGPWTPGPDIGGSEKNWKFVFAAFFGLRRRVFRCCRRLCRSGFVQKWCPKFGCPGGPAAAEVSGSTSHYGRFRLDGRSSEVQHLREGRADIMSPSAVFGVHFRRISAQNGVLNSGPSCAGQGRGFGLDLTLRPISSRRLDFGVRSSGAYVKGGRT